MAKAKIKVAPVIQTERVDPIDAEAAIADIASILRHREMSSTDLGLEIGWSRNKVDEFLYGVDIPTKEDFITVADWLGYELDI